MTRNDLALKGLFDGVELLIFPSNQLPENSQRKKLFHTFLHCKQLAIDISGFGVVEVYDLISVHGLPKFSSYAILKCLGEILFENMLLRRVARFCLSALCSVLLVGLGHMPNWHSPFILIQGYSSICCSIRYQNYE